DEPAEHNAELPVELPDLQVWAGDAGVETASLAPFAGEADATAPPIPEPVLPQPAAPEPAAVPTAEAEQGVPFAGDGERMLEPAEADTAPAAAVPAPHPGDEVQTITEKPTNPRRGWWQRLLQP
ncbi:MAG TPA: hypothetical protein VJR70_00945, partial [Stellaceae bacterium]|nr:hypothetical protein [Stellaceae bacterium]